MKIYFYKDNYKKYNCIRINKKCNIRDSKSLFLMIYFYKFDTMVIGI